MLKSYCTVEDVLHSPWALPGALSGKQAEHSDRVLKSTKLEDSIYHDLRCDDAMLDEIECEAKEKLKSFPSLSRDIYQSFYSLSPRKVDEEDLSVEAQKFNSNILTRMTEQDDYPTLKNICEGRDLLSYEAASEFIARTADNLDDMLSEMGGEKGTMSTLEKLQASQTQWEQNLSELLDRRKMSKQPDEQLDKALVAAANQLQSKSQQTDAVSKLIETSMIRQMPQTDEFVASAVSSAKAKAEEVQEIIDSWSDDPGNMSRCPMNMQLLAKVRSSPQLKAVSKYLGRFREIFAQGKKNGFAYGRGEKYSLELGNDLSRALTSELAMLAAPSTVPLFLRKYQQKQIKQYQRREPIRKGMGDIICCIDESGSTAGDAATWAKAVALTLLELAAEGNRKFAIIHFSGPCSFKTDIFLPGAYTTEDKMRAAEVFLDGGTNFETPMAEAIRLMEEESFENADIIFITDGECELSKEFALHLQQFQAQKHFTITGILLDQGVPGMEFSLKSFCQNIYRTSELAGVVIVGNLLM